MISIDNVSFGYGEAQETLSQVSAAIAPGECVLLCGASGCGKTTVTKLNNGLIPSFTPGCRLEGRVEVDGLDPGTTPMYELARKVGSVFQNPKSQFFNLDTDSELAFGLENEGWLPEEVLQRNKSPYPKTHHPACRSCWTPPALPCSSSWTAPPWWNCSRRAPRRPGTAS